MSFDVEHVARNQAAIVESEFAACLHGARGMTPEAHAENLRAFPKLLDELWQAAGRQRISYVFSEIEWDDMAFGIAGPLWLILIQFGKLVGTRLGNGHLGEGELTLEGVPAELEAIGPDADH